MTDGAWRGGATSSFGANQPDAAALPSPCRTAGGKHVMRVHKGDLIALHENDRSRIMVVHRLDAAARRFKLAAHNESGNLDQRHGDPADPFRWLMASYS